MLIRLPEMASSAFPFHGIFSGLGQDAGTREEESGSPPPSGAGPSVGRIAVDIYEQDDYYIIKAPIAGVRLSDIDIEIADNVITIKGTRPQTDNIPESQYYLQECFWGPFSRSITLPSMIDPKKVKATFNKECILKILVPKEERVKIVRINEG